MNDILLRMLLLATVGLIVVLLLRCPLRRVFGAGPAFTLWLLPLLLAAAPWLPLPHRAVAPSLLTRMLVTPGLAPSW